ncbi:hypothetical protein JAAARDRAFT_39461 [Jaapia argillacea MUCL 33604]|uniref:Uncharacterized protein n=1 Tax=Jaapia argillacea MUCL 33604 TaxID=933084 RepID=A0A067PHZ3_9AGAM|nr:hypothetical protein JAAARDRAFT_39461 [Jaapia argillacea MUCL 33604]
MTFYASFPPPSLSSPIPLPYKRRLSSSFMIFHWIQPCLAQILDLFFDDEDDLQYSNLVGLYPCNDKRVVHTRKI